MRFCFGELEVLNVLLKWTQMDDWDLQPNFMPFIRIEKVWQNVRNLKIVLLQSAWPIIIHLLGSWLTQYYYNLLTCLSSALAYWLLSLFLQLKPSIWLCEITRLLLLFGYYYIERVSSLFATCNFLTMMWWPDEIVDWLYDYNNHLPD